MLLKPDPPSREDHEASPCSLLENELSTLNYLCFAPRPSIDLPMRLSRSDCRADLLSRRHNVVSPPHINNQYHDDTSYRDEMRGLVHVDDLAPTLPALDKFDFNGSAHTLTPEFSARIASFLPQSPFFEDEDTVSETSTPESKSCRKGKAVKALSNIGKSTHREDKSSTFQPIAGVSLISGNAFTAVATYAGKIDDAGIYLASWER